MTSLWKAENVKYSPRVGKSGESSVELKTTGKEDRHVLHRSKGGVIFEITRNNFCGLLRGIKKCSVNGFLRARVVKTQYLSIVQDDDCMVLEMQDSLNASDQLDQWTKSTVAHKLHFVTSWSKVHWSVGCTTVSPTEKKMVSLLLCRDAMSIVEHIEDTGHGKCIKKLKLDLIKSCQPFQDAFMIYYENKNIITKFKFSTRRSAIICHNLAKLLKHSTIPKQLQSAHTESTTSSEADLENISDTVALIPPDQLPNRHPIKRQISAPAIIEASQEPVLDVDTREISLPTVLIHPTPPRPVRAPNGKPMMCDEGVQTDPEDTYMDMRLHRFPFDIDSIVCASCGSTSSNPSNSESLKSVESTQQCSSLPSNNWSIQPEPDYTWININELTNFMDETQSDMPKHVVNYISQYTSTEIAPKIEYTENGTLKRTCRPPSQQAKKNDPNNRAKISARNENAHIQTESPVTSSSPEYMSAKNICTTLYYIQQQGFIHVCHTLGLTKGQIYALCLQLYMGDNSQKDWKAFAELVGLTDHSVQVIDAFVKNLPCKVTAAEIVLYHWKNTYPKYCARPFNLKELKNMLREIGRYDIIESVLPA